MNQLDSTEINIVLLALGGLVLALGLLSGSIFAHGLTAVPFSKLYHQKRSPSSLVDRLTTQGVERQNNN